MIKKKGIQCLFRLVFSVKWDENAFFFSPQADAIYLAVYYLI